MIARNAYYDPSDPKSSTNPIAKLYLLDAVPNLDVKWVNRMIGYPQIIAAVVSCVIGRFDLTAGAIVLLVSALLLSNISMHIIGKTVNKKK